MTIKNNSEILFLYDARISNPNGDMDNENKPRMDLETGTNLVSDVRLKRYIRDYLETFKGEDLFVTSSSGIEKKEKDAKAKAKERLSKKEKTAKDCIDVKLFGAVLAEEGSAQHYSGPVQFNWGYSLNKVELQDSKTIKSSISEEGVGKDFRVKYSLIAFSGSINAKNAEPLALSEENIKLFDEAMIKCIPLSRTRSKIGQTPRFYMRAEMVDSNSYLKDLREYVSLNREKNYSSIEDVEIDFKNLTAYLTDNKDKISKIIIYKDDKLEITNYFNVTELKKKILNYND